MMGGELLYLAVGIAASLFMAFNMGANDATNPTQAAVGPGVLSVRRALLLFALFVSVGAVAQGYMVMKTVGKGIVPEIGVGGAVAAVLGGGAWVLLATMLGMPVSTSQSIVGGVLGVGVSYVLLGLLPPEQLGLGVLVKIVLSWITSPLLAIALAAGLYHAFLRLYRRLGPGRRGDRVFRYLIVAALIFSSYAYGTNDIANATGVYVTVVGRILGTPDAVTMMYLALLGSAGIAIGGYTLGHRVIRTVAYRITKLDYVTGCASGFANALVVWVFTTVPYILFRFGMPISTTHASVSSVIGVGLAKYGIRGVNWGVVVKILVSWLLTLPASALFAMAIHAALIHLGAPP